MNNKKITLSVESDIYDKYMEHCRKNGIIISKKVELFMKKELENIKSQKERKSQKTGDFSA